VKDGARYIILSFVLIVVIFTGFLQPVERQMRRLVSSLGSVVLSDRQAAELADETEINRLKFDNQQLRDDLKLNKKYGDSLLAASITARSSDLFDRSVIIDKGDRDGIKLNNAVMAQGVVIGTVQSVRSKESTVLLIQDQDFRLDVAIDNKERGVLKGGINGPYIDRVLPDVQITEGQLITTGVSNSNIASGLPVGRTVGVINRSDDVFQKVQVAIPFIVNQVSSLQVVIR